ncbi:MAG: hypothetical protein HY370_02300 [Proteobacteria bacterium]|nr:hypothetical protein [Pseudomonadota bacterium]
MSWDTHFLIQGLDIIADVGDLGFDDGNVLAHLADHAAAGDIIVDLALELADSFVGNGLLLDDPGDELYSCRYDRRAVR